MILYLDNAATSFPKPKEVSEQVAKCLSICGNPGRSGHEISLESANQVFICRNEICSFFHYDKPDNVVFTLNATYALNMAICALYQEGCHVLISDLEHNAVYRPIHHLASEGKLSYSVFSHYGDVIGNIRKLTTNKTKLLVCLHASNVTGDLLPIAQIGQYCKKNNIRFIIDASQSAGHIQTDLSNMYFDAYCAPGHKGLLGIQGCGFAIINAEHCERDFVLGGTGSHSFLPHMPLALPDRYEAGTLPTPAICALRSGITYLANHAEKSCNVGVKAQRLYTMLANIRGCRLVSKPRNPSGIVSFTCKNQSELAKYYAENHVCIRSGFHCAPLAHHSIGTEEEGCIRTSLGVFTTDKEIERFVSLTEGFLKRGRI